MDDYINVTVNVNKHLYEKVRDAIGYSKSVRMFKDRDLPITDEEVINSALYYYFEKMETVLGLHTVEKSKYTHNGKVKNRFKQILKQVDMKQRELATLTGIDDATVSQVLSNRNQPTVDNFLKMWAVLGNPPIEEIFYRERE